MGTNIKQLLFIDDNAEYRSALQQRLGKLFPDAKVVEYDPLVKGWPSENFNWEDYDLLLLDYELGKEESGLDWFNKYKQSSQFPTTVMLTGEGSEALAVQAIKSGIYNYINKQKITDQQLQQVIFEALEYKKRQSNTGNFVTLQGGIFNKSLFYKRLEETIKNQDEHRQRALLLIRLDNLDTLVESHGLIISDNLVRHLARVSYEAYSSDNLNPNITRFGDHSVAMLIDFPNAEEEIISSLKQLCAHIDKRPFMKDSKEISFSVSIGFVHLNNAPGNAKSIFAIANKTCEFARKQSGNSFRFYLHSSDKTKIEPGPATETPETETPETETPETETPETETPETETDSNQLDLSSTILENRLFLKFCPMAKVSTSAEQQEAEFFDVSVDMVNLDGTSVESGEFKQAIANEGARILIDRWLLRNSMGKLAEAAQIDQLSLVVFIPISIETLRDKTFFDWLRNLLKNEESPRSKNMIVLEINCQDVLELKKQIKALADYLKKMHGFRFLLSDVDDIATLDECGNYIKADFIKFSDELNHALKNTGAPGDQAVAQLLNQAREIKALTIARKLVNAAELSAAIMAGADLAAGEFIGIPVDEIWETSLVESMEIESNQKPWHKTRH